MLQPDDNSPSGRFTAAPTIYRMISSQAERSPDAVALMAPERAALSYRGLLGQIDETVAALNRMGLGKGDRVALALPNGPETAAAFLAVASCAACAPLNPGYRANEFGPALVQLRCRAVIVPADRESAAAVAARSQGIAVIELRGGATLDAGRFVLAGAEQRRPARPKLAASEEIALVLQTSGTTSRPKTVPLTHGNLLSAAASIASVLELTPRDRTLLAMPLFHIHGLSALLATLATGGSVVCPPDFYANRFFAWVEEFRPTWYTASPAIHQSVLERAPMHLDVVQQAPLRFMRSASASMPPSLLAEMERVLGAPMIEAYGMTEAGPQISSNPLPPRLRKPGAVGLPAGPEVIILDENGTPRPAGEVGEVAIRGANVMTGYEDQPEENARAFTNGWLRTGDQGYRDADGYLFITGRLKEIVNRGGEKISPREVEEVLICHPAVATAVAFAVPHPKLGEEVGAAVVLRQGASADEQSIRDFLAGQLADFKIPRRIAFVAEIPRGATGKLQRGEMAARLGFAVAAAPPKAPAEPDTDALEAGTPTEKALAAIWAEVLECEHVGLHDDFFQLGGDSILATQILARVAETMQAELSFLAFFDAPTVTDMARSIEEARGEGA